MHRAAGSINRTSKSAVPRPFTLPNAGLHANPPIVTVRMRPKKSELLACICLLRFWAVMGYWLAMRGRGGECPSPAAICGFPGGDFRGFTHDGFCIFGLRCCSRPRRNPVSAAVCGCIPGSVCPSVNGWRATVPRPRHSETCALWPCSPAAGARWLSNLPAVVSEVIEPLRDAQSAAGACTPRSRGSGRGRLTGFAAASNCASSVDPFSAVVCVFPPMITCATSSKYPVPT